MYTKGKDTVRGLRFKEDLSTKGPDGDWPEPSERIMGDGDGTVPLESLLYPVDLWKSAPDFETYLIEGSQHTDIIKGDEFANYVFEQACIA